MTPSQISSELRQIKSMLARLLNETSKEWISEEDAVQLSGLGKRSLRNRAKEGKLQSRTRDNGRGYQYLLTEINKLYKP